MSRPDSDTERREALDHPRLISTGSVVSAGLALLGVGMLTGALVTTVVSPGVGQPEPVLGLALSLLGFWVFVLAMLAAVAGSPARAAGWSAGFFLGLAVAWAMWVDGGPGPGSFEVADWMRVVAALTVVPALAAGVARALDARRSGVVGAGAVDAVPVAVLVAEAAWLLWRGTGQGAVQVAVLDLVLAALLVLVLPCSQGRRCVQVAVALVSVGLLALLVQVPTLGGLLPAPA